MIKRLIHFFLFITVVNANALTTQQTVFKNLYIKALAGDEKAVLDGKKQLKGYRLNHYLDYALIKAKISEFPETEINAFKDKHKQSPLGEALDKMLTYELGKQKQWVRYLKRYKNNRSSQTLHCWFLHARIETNDHKGLSQAIADFWMNGLSLPKACNPVFNWWESQGHINDDLIGQRIKLAFKTNNAATVGYLANKMNARPEWVGQALLLMHDPIKTFNQALNWTENADNLEMLYIKAKITAQKQPDKMNTIWPLLVKKFNFSAEQKANVERAIALFAATDYLPFTIDAMNALPAAQHDSQIFAWKTRYYLYHQDWSNVLKTIQSMPDFQRNMESWKYWMARALAKTASIEIIKVNQSKYILK